MRRRLLVAGLACGLVIIDASAQAAVPGARRYPITPDGALALVKQAIVELGGEVLVEAREAGTVAGHIPDPHGGAPLFLDVTITRVRSVSWVRMDSRGESEDMSLEELDCWRRRFFRKLDGLTVGQLGGQLAQPAVAASFPDRPNDAWLENPPSAWWIFHPMEMPPAGSTP